MDEVRLAPPPGDSLALETADEARGDGGRPPGSRSGIIGRRALGIRNRELEKRGLNFDAVTPGLREDLVLLQDFLYVEGRHGGLVLFCPLAVDDRQDASV